jgi:DNA-directed RNA polymerase subunit L
VGSVNGKRDVRLLCRSDIMDVKIILNEKNVLEIELDTDHSLAQVLAEKLNQDKDVDFAAYKVDHPMVAKPRLYVRTKKGDPTKIVLEKVKELKKEVAEFRKQFVDIVK